MNSEPGTRQRLLSTALQLVWEQSYSSVSVDEICRRAMATKGSFYHFFSSKSDLAVAAIEDHWQKLRPELDRIFSSQTPPVERLAAFGDFVYERQRQKLQTAGKVCGCPFTSIGSELSTQDEQIRRKSQQILERFCRYFSSALRDVAKEGVISDLDCDAKAQELYSFVMGTMVEARIRNDLEVVRQVKSRLLEVIGVCEAQVGSK